MGTATTRITINQRASCHWRATLNHLSINTVDDQMYDGIFDLVDAMEAEPTLRGVTFESASPDSRGCALWLSEGG